MANEAFDYKINRDLLSIGFIPTISDPYVYILEGLSGMDSPIPTGRVILSRAVDDMPGFLSGSPEMKTYIYAKLRELGYSITITDPTTTILGLEIERDRNARTLRLRQVGSVCNLLNEFFSEWETCDINSLPEIPAQPMHHLCARDQLLADTPCTPTQKKKYQSIVGQLIWLEHTWPELINSVHDCSIKLNNPSEYDFNRVIQIVKFVARIRRLDEDGLILGGTEGVKIVATVDTSYGTGPDLKSKTGGTLHTSHNTGSFFTWLKRHPFITDSTCASEGVGGAYMIRYILAFRYFFEELGFPQIHPSVLYMDNLPFIKTITGSNGASERAKHILLRFNLIKEAYQQGQIDIEHLNSANMPADIATKNTPKEIFQRLRLVQLGRQPIVRNTLPLSDTNITMP